MRKTPSSLQALCAGSLCLIAVILFSTRTHGASADDCVGKEYGYPGCPIINASSSSLSSSPTCGDGTVDANEQCDDGNKNGTQGDRCTRECQVLFCGDGIFSPDLPQPYREECEPQQKRYYSMDPASGQLTTEWRFVGATCGRYCTASCQWKFLAACASSDGGGSSAVTIALSSSPGVGIPATVIPIAQSPQLSKSTCGNGVRDTGEECDDGNQINTDGCTNECRLPRCGDAIIQPGEQCDDGVRNSDTQPDACRMNCSLPRCGDGTVDKGEQCDDANQINTDGCTNDCRIARCGDGIIENGEQCDDGTANSDTKPNACRTNCTVPVCGDGVVDRAEECDDANKINNDGCSNDCRLPRCGDGIIQTGEQCDDGDRNSDYKPNACRADCVLPHCGDGIIDKNEQCDGGPQCLPDCHLLAQATDIPTQPQSGNGQTLTGILIAAIIGLCATLFYVFRRRLIPLMESPFRKKNLTIDDLPLSDIEAEHRW